MKETDHAYGGSNADKISDTEAARLDARIQRASWQRSANAMSPAQLIAWSAKRRRARITHPGKR